MCHRHRKVKSVMVDDRLQNLTNSESAIAMLLVEVASPLSPLLVAEVVDIKHKLQRIQIVRVKELDSNLEIVPIRLYDTGPLE